ncbi:MAG: Hsp20/alpha crystallin family protein [Anaerolineae bacterium]
MPSVDAWEEGDTVVVELAMPGVAPDAFDVTIERDTLVVSGEVPARADDKTYLIKERARGRFERRFDLSVPLDVDKIAATYADGILRLVLPKAESVKPRKIEVSRN